MKEGTNYVKRTQRDYTLNFLFKTLLISIFFVFSF